MAKKSLKNSKEIYINFLNDGSIKSIYHDEFFVASNKKNIRVERITDVEFDNETQQWIARLISNGQIIARDKSRNKVLQKEVTIAGDMLFNGIEIQPSKTKVNENSQKKRKKNTARKVS